jgi:MFS family permease
MRRIYTIIVFVVIASIDNTVLALLPALTPTVRTDLQLSNQAIGLVGGLNLVIVALTALFWGYRSDVSDRRRLLIAGTLAWAVPLLLIQRTASFAAFFLLIALAGVGLGCIATVGYSIITDLVSARWRGLLLGVWGLTQGIGALAGGILASALVRNGWRTPYFVMALVGIVASGLALFAVSPPKGAADLALAPNETYDYRIQRHDLPALLAKPTNRWLVAQGFIAQFAFGAFSWITTLLTFRLVAEGLELNLANGVAALLNVLLQVGGIVSLAWGWLGDRLHRRNTRARALLAAYGFWVALPCYVVLFWVPLPLAGDATGSAVQIVGTQLRQNGYWWLALLAATVAVIAQATNAPNWYAMVSDANLPEHRGTAFSLVSLGNNLGRACGVFLIGVTFDWLQQTVAPPINYAIGLTIFQLFFLPAGLCFWLAARTMPHDVAMVQATLHSRQG